MLLFLSKPSLFFAAAVAVLQFLQPALSRSFFFDSAPLSLIFGPPFARASLNLVMCGHFLTLELISTSFIFANLRGRVRKLCKAECSMKRHTLILGIR